MPGSEGCPWDRTEFVDHEQVQDALFALLLLLLLLFIRPTPLWQHSKHEIYMCSVCLYFGKIQAYRTHKNLMHD